MPRASTPIVELDRMSLAFRTDGSTVRALRGVSLSIAEGEAVGLVGESGSGKSTLARALLGLNPERTSRIESGRVLIQGRDVTGYRERDWEGVRGDPIAMVFQDPLSALNPVMRIGRQIAESVLIHTPELPVVRRVDELIGLVRLPAQAANAYPHELSGGMRQRALLAVALACRPRLLVADEPTTALDVTTQAEILTLLKDLRRELGMALLLISHDLGVVAAAAERITVMYAGHLVEAGPTGSVFAAPAHPYAAGLLAAAEARRAADGRFQTIAGDPPNLSAAPSGCPFQDRCAFVMDRCRSQMPAPLALAGSEDRWVRCWRYEGSVEA